MILTLAIRHLWVRKRRSALLLLGFALGVGVMILLLSVGEAMLDQSRDVALVGGGEVTVLPLGIDVEAMRTGGVSGMFFGIDHARFLTRQLLGGPRHADVVRAVAPAIEEKILYLERSGVSLPVRVGGEIPSRAATVGAGLELLAGAWHDLPADSAWISPNASRRYDEMDRFHVPEKPDSTWGEWDYFNVVTGDGAWWHITLLVGGAIPAGEWGGEVLITRRSPDGRHHRYSTQVPAAQVRFDTTRADLSIGSSSVRQSDGIYRLEARAHGASGDARVKLEFEPLPNRYFPAVELREEPLLSGYVVPGVAANATGRVCVLDRCRRVTGVPAYHDHNWGVWRGVSWEWGAARGASLTLLYGGIYSPETDSAAAPFFFTVIDSLGVRQILRFRSIRYAGRRPAGPGGRVTAPTRFDIAAARGSDSVRLGVHVEDVLASRMGSAGLDRHFLQMRGRFGLTGRIAGELVADSGSGFFETYVP
jgi:hypothetical protein